MNKDLTRALGKIEGKLEGIEIRVGEVKQGLEKLDARIRKIERNSAILGGSLGAISASIFEIIKSKMNM